MGTAAEAIEDIISLSDATAKPAAIEAEGNAADGEATMVPNYVSNHVEPRHGLKIRFAIHLLFTKELRKSRILLVLSYLIADDIHLATTLRRHQSIGIQQSFASSAVDGNMLYRRPLGGLPPND
ncbi:hypothetical protein ACJJTC_013723 [Scirpophaga incertulas]